MKLKIFFIGALLVLFDLLPVGRYAQQNQIQMLVVTTFDFSSAGNSKISLISLTPFIEKPHSFRHFCGTAF